MLGSMVVPSEVHHISVDIENLPLLVSGCEIDMTNSKRYVETMKGILSPSNSG